MKRWVVLGTAVVAFATPGAAGAANWGQEVKACNQSSCYPGETNRGAYVSGQGTDAQRPGYAWEIHTLASPGSANPSPVDASGRSG